MSEQNPFSLAYLTEASLTTQDLLARYSFLPFLYVQNQLSATTNVFLVGRKGVGKTMILKVFEPEFQRLIYASDSSEHRNIRKRLPESAIGLYLNLASPSARTTLFQGMDWGPRWWLRAYSDFLNTLLLDMAFDALATLSAVPAWAEANLREPIHSLGDSSFTEVFFRALRRESSEYDSIASLAEFRQLTRTRIQHWSRYVNRDPSTPTAPLVPLSLGVPLFGFVAAARATQMFRRPFRLFLLIDQYESLYQHRRVVDFRPAFNQAMYEASRGGTGVEFKVGTRQYSYRNLGLIEEGGRIEAGREMVEVHLDQLAKRFYRRFAIELINKRLSAVAGNLRGSGAVRQPSEYLPPLSPLEEAERYSGGAAPGIPKHFASFAQRWKAHGFTEEQIDSLLAGPKINGAHPLVAILACIAVTRWLRDGTGAPVGCTAGGARARHILLREYLIRCIKNIEDRYALGSTASRKRGSSLKAVDDFVRDVEQAALFQLASAYKNQRKYYAGLDAIIRVSSNVAVVLIEILRAAYDQHILDGGAILSDPVSVEAQSEAIYRVSESSFNRIPSECDYGETLQELVGGWGVSFRKLQLELTAPQPCPNGFSFQGDIFSCAQDEMRTPREDARLLLTEAINWGLLEQQEHQDKSRGRPKRRKLYLNRVFCPYFGISEIRRKDPIYINHVDAFVQGIRRRDTPAEVRVLISKGLSQRDRRQSPLFV